MRTPFLLFTVLFALSAQADLGVMGLGDAFVFQPDKKQDFMQCEFAKKANMAFVDEAISGSKEKIRYYVQTGVQPKAVVISFHGNGGSACNMTPLASIVDKHHMTYIYAEYPGYSRDRIKPTEARILPNALAIYEHVKAHYANGMPIFVHGQSLGTGVATYVAMMEQDVAGLALDAAYTSIKDVGKHLAGGIDAVTRNTFMAKNWAPGVTAPVLMFHTKPDRIIPYYMGLEQQKNFTHAKTVDFHSYDTGEHLSMLGTKEYWDELEAFVSNR